MSVVVFIISIILYFVICEQYFKLFQSWITSEDKIKDKRKMHIAFVLMFADLLIFLSAFVVILLN